MKSRRIAKIIITVIFIFVTGILFSCESNEPELVFEQDTEENPVIDEASGDDADETELLFVYITGAVKNPGVYMMDADSRVYQVVELAGGFLEGADQRNINLADRVYDGMKIVIYYEGEEISALDSSVYKESDSKVNINTAALDELMTLPGIGESKARSIIEYRENVGLFGSIEEIMNVSGIKEGAFNKIKDYITI